jgi:hypothetical protein
LTLISVLVTKDYIIQASDRRSTSVEGKLPEDNTNKAIIVCTHMAVSYTGLAQINLPQNTDDWIIESLEDLKHPPVTQVLHQLKRRANRDFRSIKLCKQKKRHAFVVAGWTLLNRDQPHTPFVSTVSNALSKSWTWENESRPTFKVDIEHLHEMSAPKIFWFGTPFNGTFKENISNQILAELTAGAEPNIIIQSIQLAFRHIADRLGSSGPVGKNIMAIYLPRKAAGKMSGVSIPLTDTFQKDTIVAKFLWDGQDKGKRLGPDFIGCHPGGHYLMKDISIQVSPRN